MQRLRMDRMIVSQGLATRAGAQSLVKQGRVALLDPGTFELVDLRKSKRLRRERLAASRESQVEVEEPHEVVWTPSQKVAFEAAVAPLRFAIDDQVYTYEEYVYCALHKPIGYEVSHNPRLHDSVYDLLPAPYVARGVTAAGRLDVDSTGLLLFSDNGRWLQSVIAPVAKVPKLYEVTTERPLASEDVAQLTRGVLLHGDLEPVIAAAAERIDSHRAMVTIMEGKYHQVRRMLAAVGHHVTALTRHAIGDLDLGDLGEGEFRRLAPDEVNLFSDGAIPASKKSRKKLKRRANK